MTQWDAFISHASEDKPFVRELAERLQEAGVRVWYDEFELEVGDSLFASISKGLANSSYGIVVFSPHFFSKKWTNDELEGLFLRQEAGKRLILPVWHGVDAAAMREYSLMLAGKVAVSSELGTAHVVRRLLRAMFPDRVDRSTWEPYEIDVGGLTAVVLPVGSWKDRALWISKHPVLNKQYRPFVEEVGSGEPVGEHFLPNEHGENRSWQGPFHPWREDNFNQPNKPVVCVSYKDARRFCTWLNAKVGSTASVALPSFEMWQFATFGAAAYPPFREDWLKETKSIHHKATFPAEADASGERTNDRGVADLIGNVWEWCRNDVLEPTTTFTAVIQHRAFLQSGDPAVCGGGFLDDLTASKICIRAANLPQRTNTVHSDLGFRVAGRVDLGVLPSKVRIHLSSLPVEDWARDDGTLSVPSIANPFGE